MNLIKMVNASKYHYYLPVLLSYWPVVSPLSFVFPGWMQVWAPGLLAQAASRLV